MPLDLFKVILTDTHCVRIEDSVISISTGSTKQDKVSASITVPNPLLTYHTLDEARKAIGFTFVVPETLPDGYQLTNIMVINNNLAEIIYLKGDRRIIYRTAQGNADISGDYNVYNKIKTVTVENTKILVKGKNDGIHLAIWTKEGVSFSLSFDEAVKEDVLAMIMKSFKE